MEATTLTPEQIEQAKEILNSEQKAFADKQNEFKRRYDELCKEFGMALVPANTLNIVRTN
mgnify:CR=1 FL=1